MQHNAKVGLFTKPSILIGIIIALIKVGPFSSRLECWNSGFWNNGTL